MINLRFRNQEDEHDAIEYFINDKAVEWLPGIKQLNIIVGANNTRKSRFLRSIIKTQHKAIINSRHDLNDLLINAQALIDALQQLQKFIPEGILQVNEIIEGRQESIVYESVVSDGLTKDRVVGADTFIAILKDVQAELRRVISEDGAKSIDRKVEQLLLLASLGEHLYKLVRIHHNSMPHNTEYRNLSTRELSPIVPGKSIGDTVLFVDELLELFGQVHQWVELFEDIEFSYYNKDNIYIPALRSSRQFKSNDDIFAEVIRQNHFKTDHKHIRIETGLQLYRNIQYARNGDRDQIRNFHAFEKFIGETFFESDDIHIIPYRGPSLSDDMIKISLPGELENIPIHDLGEGVQSIINLLFPVFTAPEKSWIYIDEPENHLHPGYQNIFIKAITQNSFLKSRNHRFFINTHSNHILSESFLSGADTSIFVFSKRDEQSSNISHFNQNEYSTLELLGVMNTSVLITNCSIWVEGVTDRFYLRAFLHAYNQTLTESDYQPSEGFDYSFVEYGGKNLVHYDFDNQENENIAAYFINSNVFLLADEDFDSKKHERYKNIDRGNFEYHTTALPEIENLLPEALLKAFLLEALKCDEDSVARIFPLDHHAKLGKLFSEVSREGKTLAIESKTGGTLAAAYKSKLAQFTHEKIITGSFGWADLETSPPLKTIVEKLYRFISGKNKIGNGGKFTRPTD